MALFETTGDMDFLTGGGEMASLTRSFRWENTPLGPIYDWPHVLKTSVGLILGSRHPMWIGWGPEMTFLYNDAYLHVLGTSKHPWALGRPAAEVWAEVWDVCGPLARGVFERREAAFVDDVRLFMNRGKFVEETFYSFSYSPILDANGNVSGLFCPSTDVTPKVLNARRLRTLSELAANALVEKTIRSALASAMATLAKNPDDVPFALLYLVDAQNGRATLEHVVRLTAADAALTPAVVDLSGAAAESVWPIARVFGASHGEVISVARFESLPLGAADQPLKHAIVMPVASPGQDKPVAVLAAGINPARMLDTEYQTFFELVASQLGTAIQSARAAEEEKIRADRLAELDRAKTAFFSNVSHELRTPLTLLLGPIENALASRDAAQIGWHEIEIMHRNAVRLLKLVNNLLDFSRIEGGRLRAAYEPVDLGVFTADLASVFRSAFERAGVQFAVVCDPLSQSVYVDREMWEKIVMNLLSNAFKFTLAGEVSISLKESGGCAVLQVKDSGTGIPAEELPNLFTRFHRVKGAKARTQEGSGIGLALVQELVKLHGGSVAVESVHGEGSTFTVSVPMEQRLADSQGGTARMLESTAVETGSWRDEALTWLPSASAPQAIRGPIEESRGRILLADDNADMREYVRRLLEPHYQVETVDNGKGALDSALVKAPDLVLTDVMMPEMDGFELLRSLRADPKTATVPVILLSARAGEESKVEGMEAGADDYLIKPFSARELLARVRSHLQMAQLRKQMEERLRQAAKLESLGILAGGIAHDFNNLLTGILGNASLLVEHETDAFSKAAAENIVESSERAAHLTRQMLAHAGKGRYVVEWLDLSEQIPAVTALVAASVPKYVELRFELIPGAFIEADVGQLQQLVMNLVVNAAEAIDPPGGVIKVSTSVVTVAGNSALHTVTGTLPPGRYVVLQVRDTGHGMDEETKTKIFDPFFTTKFTGRGLGLAAVLGIVRGHRAGLKVSSIPGKGTTFQVLFPLAEAHAALTPAAKEPTPKGSGTILVVDDEMVVRRTAKAALEKNGYTVFVAENGLEAVEVFSRENGRVAAIVLDMTMPVMNGQDALKRIREIRPDVPVIASSGYSEGTVRQEFGDEISGFLEKPYTVERLNEVVSRVLDASARSVTTSDGG
jgi:signal transduction histidine kinase